jgi:hypothetical protein
MLYSRREFGLRKETNCALHKVVALSALLYGQKAWTLCRKHANLLDQFCQRSLRRISIQTDRTRTWAVANEQTVPGHVQLLTNRSSRGLMLRSVQQQRPEVNLENCLPRPECYSGSYRLRWSTIQIEYDNYQMIKH